MKSIKGIIFDIDGTLVLNQKALPGALETVSILKEKRYQLRLISNMTSKTTIELSHMLSSMGFNINPEEIQTAVSVCVDYLNNHRDKTVFLAIPEKLLPLFSGVNKTQDNPDFVVMGDLDSEFNYSLLNRIFNYLMSGAELITFHKNPFYFRDGRKWLDSGAFTLALEQVTGKKAVVMGKPSPVLFERAVASMGLDKREVLVIGDDVSSDIQGARNVGLKSLLVGSGKFQPSHLETYRISKDEFLPHISDLIAMLEKDDETA